MRFNKICWKVPLSIEPQHSSVAALKINCNQDLEFFYPLVSLCFQWWTHSCHCQNNTIRISHWWMMMCWQHHVSYPYPVLTVLQYPSLNYLLGGLGCNKRLRTTPLDWLNKCGSRAINLKSDCNEQSSSWQTEWYSTHTFTIGILAACWS